MIDANPWWGWWCSCQKISELAQGFSDGYSINVSQETFCIKRKGFFRFLFLRQAQVFSVSIRPRIKPKKRVAIPEYRLCMGGGMTGEYILYIIYVMPKMGEFYDNMYIQPIYKTWKMLEIWGYSFHLHFSILKSEHEKNVVFWHDRIIILGVKEGKCQWNVYFLC